MKHVEMSERDEDVMKNGDIGQGEYLVEAKYRKEKSKQEEKEEDEKEKEE